MKRKSNQFTVLHKIRGQGEMHKANQVGLGLNQS